MAGLLAYRPGHRGHFYYRLVTHRGRRGERRSQSEADYAALLSAAQRGRRTYRAHEPPTRAAALIG